MTIIENWFVETKAETRKLKKGIELIEFFLSELGEGVSKIIRGASEKSRLPLQLYKDTANRESSPNSML